MLPEVPPPCAPHLFVMLGSKLSAWNSHEGSIIIQLHPVLKQNKPPPKKPQTWLIVYFMCVSFMCLSLCTPCLLLVFVEARRRGFHHLELELQVVVSCNVGTGN